MVVVCLSLFVCCCCPCSFCLFVVAVVVVICLFVVAVVPVKATCQVHVWARWGSAEGLGYFSLKAKNIICCCCRLFVCLFVCLIDCLID